MRTRFAIACIVLVASGLLRAAPASAEEFGGIEFPGGAASFADSVASYDPIFDLPDSPSNTDSAAALGVPDDEDVSLGNGGTIIVQFTDNALTGSGDSEPDLHIFESGGQNEATFVAVSADGTSFTSVGTVFGGISNVDIDAFGFDAGDQLFFVRLIDDAASDPQPDDSRAGADIDAVGAITTVVDDSATRATITVHKATCPENAADPFAECHDNRLGGVDFAIDGFEVGSQVITTDDNGEASAVVLEAAATGDITLTEDAAVFDEYEGAFVFCSELDSGAVLVSEHTADGSVTFTASQGNEVVCDWYNLTEAGPAGTPTGDDDDDDQPTTLPNTGSGVAGGGTASVLFLLGLSAAAWALITRRRGSTA